MMITIRKKAWTKFKDVVSANGLTMQYDETPGGWNIWAVSTASNVMVTHRLKKGNPNEQDWLDNHEPGATA